MLSHFTHTHTVELSQCCCRCLLGVAAYSDASVVKKREEEVAEAATEAEAKAAASRAPKVDVVVGSDACVGCCLHCCCCRREGRVEGEGVECATPLGGRLSSLPPNTLSALDFIDFRSRRMRRSLAFFALSLYSLFCSLCVYCICCALSLIPPCKRRRRAATKKSTATTTKRKLTKARALVFYAKLRYFCVGGHCCCSLCSVTVYVCVCTYCMCSCTYIFRPAICT